MNELEIFIDGASKGNPGPSGIGVVICRDGDTIANLSKYIGLATNNVAEYQALIHGLQECLILKADRVKVNTDSQLLYRQIKKLYRVKNDNIVGLYEQATRLLSAFSGFSINNIPRENNTGADKLATLAVKEHLKKHR